MKPIKPLDAMANTIARAVGSPWATMFAVLAVLALATAGLFLGFNAEWQLLVNTFLTLVTFLVVFLIQHTQNGETAALHVKLDELLRVVEKADQSLLDLEHADHHEIETLRAAYHELAARKRNGASHIEHAERSDLPTPPR